MNGLARDVTVLWIREGEYGARDIGRTALRQVIVAEVGLRLSFFALRNDEAGYDAIRADSTLALGCDRAREPDEAGLCRDDVRAVLRRTMCRKSADVYDGCLESSGNRRKSSRQVRNGPVSIMSRTAFQSSSEVSMKGPCGR